ncbi:MAG: pyridoxal phosphate-dependent aminotransferase [Micrococcaceae bacterium]
MDRISKNIGQLSESVTLAVDAKAKELKAAGRPVISFGAGEPDFPTPDYIVEAAIAAAKDPKNHRYSPASGLPELREAIVKKTKRDSGYEVDVANVVVTNGGKQAVFESFLAIFNPEDEVILPTPYWTTYPEVIKLAGAKAITPVAGADQDYKLTVKQLEEVYTDKTKALIFVSPSNPTGAVYTEEEVKAIGKWAVEKDIWVITDEIYEHLVYGDNKFTSIATATPDLEKVIILNGVAKTYAMTGWRVGWMIAPKDVAKAVTNLQSHATSNVANVSQRAALAAIEGPLDAVKEMRIAFDRRRKYMYETLREVPGLVLPEPQGAFYAYIDVSKYATDTTALAEEILEKEEVAVVPGEAFGTSGYIRLSYALGDDDLKEGLSRLVSFFKKQNSA